MDSQKQKKSTRLHLTLHHLKKPFYKKSKKSLLENRNILKYITYHLCSNIENTSTISKIFTSLQRVNKFLYRYYTDAIIQEQITRIIATHQKRCLISHLIQIAEDKNAAFTKHDLHDKRSLNTTFSRKEQTNMLLHITVANLDYEKTKALLDAGANPKHAKCPSLIVTLCNIQPDFLLHLQNIRQEEDYYMIIKLLLDAGLDPDDRNNLICPTLLHQAVHWNYKNCARLLLSYEANPFNLYIYPQSQSVADKFLNISIENEDPDKIKHNAFTLESGEPKDWLKSMYEDIQRNKKTV